MRLFLLLLTLLASASAAATPPPAAWPSKTFYRSVDVDGHRTFYREAGERSRPTLLLLHGYPSSSHTYRELIPLLSGHYHVVAPDYLGSGLTDHPDPSDENYTFERLARHIAAFTDAVGLQRYSLYMQDFGAPVGFRLMQLQPERLQALVAQNANAYLDGLTPARLRFFEQAHRDASPGTLLQLHGLTSAEGVINLQYLRNVKDRPEKISPDAWHHDLSGLASQAQQLAQVQLFQDYWTNLEAYPEWQAFLRAHQPPALGLWGKHDPAFIAAGALAYRRDLPDADISLIDAGHFAVEEHAVLIAQRVVTFLGRLEQQGQLAPDSTQ